MFVRTAAADFPNGPLAGIELGGQDLVTAYPGCDDQALPSTRPYTRTVGRVGKLAPHKR
jgi:hypothetical protein